jgi:predicted kinase
MKKRVCILISGIPASGKSTFANRLSEHFKIPMISKDTIKDHLYDVVGFDSRAEKVKLGTASTNIMYYYAEQMMKVGQVFILENNFEYVSEAGLQLLLEDYGYTAITITLTGEYEKIYRRFLERDNNSQKQRGRAVNGNYSEKTSDKIVDILPYEDYVWGIKQRGMDTIKLNGPQIKVDTTNFKNVDWDKVFTQIKGILEDE